MKKIILLLSALVFFSCSDDESFSEQPTENIIKVSYADNASFGEEIIIPGEFKNPTLQNVKVELRKGISNSIFKYKGIEYQDMDIILMNTSEDIEILYTPLEDETLEVQRSQNSFYLGVIDENDESLYSAQTLYINMNNPLP